MSLELLKKDINEQNLAAVYLLYGEDRYSLLQCVSEIKEIFLKDDPSGSNIEVFQGKDSSVERIMESLNSSSFFARKLVIVDDIPYFDNDKGKNGSEEEKEQETGSTELLISYFDDPNPSSTLFLVASKANKGRRLYKSIAKTGKIIEFTMPSELRDWQEWIVNRSRANGNKISGQSAAFLAEWAGHNTGILGTELDKLAIYLGERQEITTEDIAAVCIPMTETTVFKMLDGIAAKNSREALQKLREVTEREHYLKINTMIVRQVRLLLTACYIRANGGKAEELMRVASIKPFEANKVFRQSVKFSFEMLEKAMEDCLETDLAFKTSGSDPHLLLEIMVIKLCS